MDDLFTFHIFYKGSWSEIYNVDRDRYAVIVFPDDVLSVAKKFDERVVNVCNVCVYWSTAKGLIPINTDKEVLAMFDDHAARNEFDIHLFAVCVEIFSEGAGTIGGEKELVKRNDLQLVPYKELDTSVFIGENATEICRSRDNDLQQDVAISGSHSDSDSDFQVGSESESTDVCSDLEDDDIASYPKQLINEEVAQLSNEEFLDLDGDKPYFGVHTDSSEDSDLSHMERRSWKRELTGIPYEESEHGKVALKIGHLFDSIHHLREVMRMYCLQEGILLKKIKNDSLRYTMACSAHGCKWRLHASRLKDGITFKIKTFNDKHNCSRTDANKYASSKFIASELLSQLKINPKMKLDLMREELTKKYSIEVNNQKLCRARQTARKINEAASLECFKQDARSGRARSNTVACSYSGRLRHNRKASQGAPAGSNKRQQTYVVGMERRRANMKRARSNKLAIKGGTKLNAVETKTRSRLWSKSTGTNVVVDPTQESVNN